MQRYPRRLRRDENKIADGLKTVIGSGQHYAMVLVNEAEGKIVGALLAVSTDALWVEGKSCQIVLWVSYAPGGGRELLKRFKKWVIGRRSNIQVAGFAMDVDVDRRAWALAERVGFKRYGSAYLHYN